MNVYACTDYRDLIRKLSKERGITFREIALHTRIHASYFSRVMLEKAEFSQDQLYQIGRHLTLREEELEFLMILGDYGRSSHSAHRTYLMEKIRAMADQRSRVGDRLEGTRQFDEKDMGVYYQESLTARVHMYLTIEKFRNSPILIARKLNISEEKLKGEVRKLKALNLVEETPEGNVSLTSRRVHLPAESHISPQNHINWRLEAISAIARRAIGGTDYHMSATFTTTAEGKQRIRELFKEFVGNAQREAGASGTGTGVYALAFDLFDA